MLVSCGVSLIDHSQREDEVMGIFEKFIDGPEKNIPATWDGENWVHDTSNRCDACSGPNPSKNFHGDRLCEHCYAQFAK